MKKYKYSSTQDPKKEAVGIICAHSFDNAVQMAAERKQLSIDAFLALFTLSEIQEKKK